MIINSQNTCVYSLANSENSAHVLKSLPLLGVDKTWGRPWPTLWSTLWPSGDRFFLKLGSGLLLTCVDSMPHESVTTTTIFCPFGGVSLRKSNYYRAPIANFSFAFQREYMEPFSIKRIVFIVVQAMGICIQYYNLVVIMYFAHLVSENSSVIASKQEFMEVTETGTQSARNEQASAR